MFQVLEHVLDVHTCLPPQHHPNKSIYRDIYLVNLFVSIFPYTYIYTYIYIIYLCIHTYLSYKKDSNCRNFFCRCWFPKLLGAAKLLGSAKTRQRRRTALCSASRCVPGVWRCSGCSSMFKVLEHVLDVRTRPPLPPTPTHRFIEMFIYIVVYVYVYI